MPLYPGKGKLIRVYVMENSTIPDEKTSHIELFEKSAAGHLGHFSSDQ